MKNILCSLFLTMVVTQIIYAKEYPEYKPKKNLEQEYNLILCLLSHDFPSIEMERKALIKENIPFLIHIIKNDGNVSITIELEYGESGKKRNFEIPYWKIPENISKEEKKRTKEHIEDKKARFVENAMSYLIILDHEEAVKYIFQKADKYAANEIFIKQIRRIIKKGGCEKEIFEGGISMLKNDSPLTNMKAVEVLGELGDERAIPYLEEYIEKNKNRPELYYKIDENEVIDWIKNDDKQKLQKFYSKERLKIALKEAKEAIEKIKNKSKKKK